MFCKYLCDASKSDLFCFQNIRGEVRPVRAGALPARPGEPGNLCPGVHPPCPGDADYGLHLPSRLLPVRHVRPALTGTEQQY